MALVALKILCVFGLHIFKIELYLSVNPARLYLRRFIIRNVDIVALKVLADVPSVKPEKSQMMAVSAKV